MQYCNLPLIVIGVLLAGTLPAERLPVRNYSSLDGLPGISVHRIVPDSKGFLWFCTNEGVSRFDGYGFVNYGRANGLSDPNVYDILETREGSYWVGTATGLFRLTKPGGIISTSLRRPLDRNVPISRRSAYLAWCIHRHSALVMATAPRITAISLWS